jgi:N-acyl-D-amino-acid deacylase
MKRLVGVLAVLCVTITFWPYRISSSQTTTVGVTAITRVTLLDGSGKAPVANAVVIVRGETIAAVGKMGAVKIPAAARIIDGSGLVLAPGFIDTHNHSDRGFDSDPSAKTQVSQGITTLAVGQDGGSELPIGEYLARLDRSPVATNVVTFVGHATVRSAAMNEDTNRQATQAEIEKMKTMVEQAMRDGAFGLSSGLEYETGKPATTEEVIALATRRRKFWWNLHQSRSGRS